jgi:hypothetical protein
VVLLGDHNTAVKDERKMPGVCGLLQFIAINFQDTVGLNIGSFFAPNRVICRHKKQLNKLSLSC